VFLIINMPQNTNAYSRFVIIKTKLTTKRKKECKKEKIIYMLLEASHPKAGQIGLAFL
jgi:hypothetical protein